MFTCSPKIVDYITYVLYLMINWRSFQITAQVKTILKTVHLISGVFAKTVGDTMGGFNGSISFPPKTISPESHFPRRPFPPNVTSTGEAVYVI